MIGLRTKREEECPLVSCEDLTALLKYQIKSLPSKEINRARLNEMSQLLESLRIVIQAKQVTLEK